MYSNIFQTEEREKFQNNKEFDYDEDYENISIPFECSIPNKQMESFLKDTIPREAEGTSTVDLQGFDTFSPHLKEGSRQIPSQKDINTGFLHRPPTTVHKNKNFNDTNEWNLMVTRKSFEFMNKPHQNFSKENTINSEKEANFLKEIEKYKLIAEEFKQKHEKLEKEVKK